MCSALLTKVLPDKDAGLASASVNGHEKLVRVLAGAVPWLHGLNSTSDPWCDIGEPVACLREQTPINMMTLALPQSFQKAITNLKLRIGQFGKQNFEQSISSFSDFIYKSGTSSVPPENCFTDLGSVAVRTPKCGFRARDPAKGIALTF